MRKLKNLLLISLFLSLFVNCKDDKKEKDENLVKGLVVGAAAGSASANANASAEKMSRIHFTLIDEITGKPIDFSKIATLKIIMGDMEKSYSKTANGTISLTATNPVGSYGDFTFDFISGVVKVSNIPVKREYTVHATFDTGSYNEFRSNNTALWDQYRNQAVGSNNTANTTTTYGQSNGTAQQIDPTVKENYNFTAKITPAPTAPAYTIILRNAQTGALLGVAGNYRVIYTMDSQDLTSTPSGISTWTPTGYVTNPVVLSGTVDATSKISIEANKLIRRASYKIEVYGVAGYADPFTDSSNRNFGSEIFRPAHTNVGGNDAETINLYLYPIDSTFYQLKLVATSNIDNACNAIVSSGRSITYTFNQQVEVDSSILSLVPSTLFSSTTGITPSTTFTSANTSAGLITVAASGNTVTVTLVATEAQLTTACTTATQTVLGMTLSANNLPTSTCTSGSVVSSGEISYTFNSNLIKVRRKSMTAEGTTVVGDYTTISAVTKDAEFICGNGASAADLTKLRIR